MTDRFTNHVNTLDSRWLHSRKPANVQTAPVLTGTSRSVPSVSRPSPGRMSRSILPRGLPSASARRCSEPSRTKWRRQDDGRADGRPALEFGGPAPLTVGAQARRTPPALSIRKPFPATAAACASGAASPPRPLPGLRSRVVQRPDPVVRRDPPTSAPAVRQRSRRRSPCPDRSGSLRPAGAAVRWRQVSRRTFPDWLNQSSPSESASSRTGALMLFGWHDQKEERTARPATRLSRGRANRPAHPSPGASSSRPQNKGSAASGGMPPPWELAGPHDPLRSHSRNSPPERGQGGLRLPLPAADGRGRRAGSRRDAARRR